MAAAKVTGPPASPSKGKADTVLPKA
jgi:hypothetical protein